ncbi:PadR family transcriptional regulator [Flindersiella endophytica]
MSLRHAMLGLLSEGPASGYDLMGRFEASLSYVWPATQSQIYTELGKLADAGLIEVNAEGPRGRKEYALTDAGLAELRHWMTEVEPVPNRRTDRMLRVFFLGAVSAEEAQAYLRRQAESARQEHQELKQVLALVEEHADDPLSTYGRLPLEWGLRATALLEEWSEWAANELRK